MPYGILPKIVEATKSQDGALEAKHVISMDGGATDFDEIWHADAELHAESGEMVKMETGCRNPKWRTFIF